MHQEGETVRPVITDTAQWHLNIYLSERKMAAYLRNISEKDIKVYKVLDVKFRSPEDLLSQVESVVYDNPYILDDFSSDIIISTDKFTFLPNEAEEYSEDLSDELVTTVFEDEEPSEFFSDKGEKYTCKYFFLKGLKDFFGRTFP